MATKLKLRESYTDEEIKKKRHINAKCPRCSHKTKESGYTQWKPEVVAALYNDCRAWCFHRNQPEVKEILSKKKSQ